MDFFIDMHQYGLIAEAKAAAGEARADASYMKSKTMELLELQRRLDKLALINHAMWNLLQQHAGLSENDLIEEVNRIDLLDGQLDGKRTIPAKKCSKCNRLVHPRHDRCMYCGHPVEIDTVFDRIS